MPSPRVTRRQPVLLAICIFVTGCSEELGPVPLNLTGVHGKVTEGRRPVNSGWVEFFPVDGTVGNLRSGRLAPDGSFKIDGVAVGKNLIRIVNLRSESKQIERLFGSMQSPIRRVVAKGSSAPIVIDLFDEAVSFKRLQETSSAGKPANTGKP